MNKKIDFKIRCSAIGKIMGDPKLKKDKEAGNLSETAKSYCKEYVLEKLFNRRNFGGNKYTEKGIVVEQQSIDFLIDNGFLFIAEKNTERKTNEYMTGECDVLQPSEIWDVKNSWGLFTFPFFETENKNKDYEWQAQGYMELYDRNNYKLAYILSNTPQHLIDKELDYKSRDIDFSGEKEYNDFESEILKNHIFDDIPAQNRVKIFKFKRDKNKAIAIKTKVAKCQEYINLLVDNL